MTFYVRTLPHWQPPGKDIFITWRLHGSLPATSNIPENAGSAGKRFRMYDRILDRATTGPHWLEDPFIAESVISAFLKGHEQKMFRLHAYVLMVNHVHLLLEPLSPVPRITHLIKASTAREANRILDLTGNRFWQDESFDHWIRNTGQWNRVRSYIVGNPVAAGLVKKPEQWPWSSAARPIL